MNKEEPTTLIENIKIILEKNSIKPNTVLDLGCGNCPYSLVFDKKTEIEAWDINMSINLYKKINGYKNIKFKFRNLNKVKNLQSFDLVIASLSLHFLKPENLPHLINEIKKSKQFLLIQLNEKQINRDLLKEFELLDKVTFETPPETHNGLKEHTHTINIELFTSLKS